MKKKLVAIFLMALCAAFAFALAACGQEEEVVEEEPAAVDTAAYSSDPFYVLVVGNDTRIGTTEINKAQYADGNARSDTMMLVRVDPTSYQITIVSIPRDTYAEIDGEVNKLNEQYQRHQIEGLVEKVQELTGVTIKYYLNASFVEFEDLVDKLNGVNVNVPIPISLKDIVHGDMIYLDAGDQTLNGPQALVLARVRKQYINMESTRQFNDRNILIALIQKAIDNPAEAAQYADSLLGTVHSNMSIDELTYYMNQFIENGDQVHFLSGSFPAEGDMFGDIWLAYYDADTWHRMMEVVDSGGDPNEVYQIPPIE